MRTAEVVGGAVGGGAQGAVLAVDHPGVGFSAFAQVVDEALELLAVHGQAHALALQLVAQGADGRVLALGQYGPASLPVGEGGGADGADGGDEQERGDQPGAQAERREAAHALEGAEAVAEAPHGLYVAGVPVGVLDLVAQTAHAGVHEPGVGVVAVLPHVLQQLLPGEDLFG